LKITTPHLWIESEYLLLNTHFVHVAQQLMDHADKPVAMNSSTAAPLPAVQPASSSAPPTLKPPFDIPPFLQSIFAKLEALPAQSSTSKSPGSALFANTTARLKLLHSSDEDGYYDVKPLSSRSSSSQSPPPGSNEVLNEKKRDGASSSKPQQSSTFLGSAGSEFKSVGHVFLSSDRSPIEKLIAGILSRWWCVTSCSALPFTLHHACLP
jgi:hypothetical protein